MAVIRANIPASFHWVHYTDQVRANLVELLMYLLGANQSAEPENADTQSIREASMTENNSDRSLHSESTLEELILYEACIDSDRPGGEVGQIFKNNPLLPGIILMAEGQLLGMLSRQHFFEYMSRPFSLELFSKRSIYKLYQFAKTELLLLDGNTSIVAAVRQSLERSPDSLYEPIIVLLATGVYKLLDVHQLLLAEMKIHEMTAVALRQSEAKLKQQATQLEQILHSLQHAQSQMIQTEKMSSLGQLVSGIAHEINNPVSFIYGNIFYVSQYSQDLMHLCNLYQQHYTQPPTEIEEAAEAIDIDFIKLDLPKALASMQSGADRIHQIVRSLRNFSRLDESEMKTVDIHEGIESTLLILQNRLKGHTGHPEIQIIEEFGDLPPVECYAGQLNQVFMNILTNASDALSEETSVWVNNGEENTNNQLPTIQIRTEVIDSDRVAIRIADNGPGIALDIQPRLFDPFFTTKSVGKGTGLGLSISYQIIVEKHGGQLKCISEPGKGSEFVIEIPIRQFHKQPKTLQYA